MAPKPRRLIRRARPFVPQPPRLATPKQLPAGSVPLFTQLCTRETLLAAWRALRRGRTQAARRFVGAADRVSLDMFSHNLDANIAGLRAELQSGQYRPDPIVHFRIPKPGGTQRTLTLYTVRDRVVQRAALDVLAPLFEPDFLPCSFGYRPNRSVANALAEVQAGAAAGNGWVVDADIANFFDTVHRGRLAQLLTARIPDPRLTALVLLWLHDPQIAASAPTQTSEPRAVPGYTLAQAAQTWVEGGLDWGIDTLAGQSALPAPRPAVLYDPESDLLLRGTWAGGNQPDMRTEALRRLGADGALLGLAVARSLFAHAGKRAVIEGALKTGAALGTASIVGAVARRMWHSHRDPQAAADLFFIGADRRGIAQGGILSPLYANIYLHAFDVALTARGLRLIRFADDLLILCHSQSDAEAALLEAERELGAIGLAFNIAKTRICPLEPGFTFLGAVRDATGGWAVPTAHTVSPTEWLAHAGWLRRSPGRRTRKGI